ncbi:MAG: deoxyguanosinetriphosphate triphosphohydrolase [bacterium]
MNDIFLLTREKLEKIEEQVLAPYAMKSKDTRGRRFPEPEDPYRSVYQRDRDRIIHSAAFRKLEYKTQVFVNHEGDYYRTRLTHTQEVAQIARSVANILRLNETLTEAIALAHDIGHTPFGHNGEKILNELVGAKEGGFEHNLQGLRVLEELEEKYPDFPGLNLTWELREGMVKHKTQYDSPVYKGYKDYELALMPTLEAQVVNIADEIAYNSHDIDDGITSGIIMIEDFKKTLIWEAIEKKLDMKKFATLSLDMQKYNITRALINIQITNLVTNTINNLKEKNIDSIDKVRKNKNQLVEFDERNEKMHKDLKKFLFDKLYKHYKVIRMEEKAERIMTDLFKIYEKRGLGDQSILPPQVKKRLEKDSLKRVLADHIAGMTDRFILDEYKKLFDPYEKV